MSINALIDAVCKCPKCGFGPKFCNCNKPKDPVTLKCTECPATKVVENEKAFMGLKEIETICPDCIKDSKKKESHERSVGTSPHSKGGRDAKGVRSRKR